MRLLSRAFPRALSLTLKVRPASIPRTMVPQRPAAAAAAAAAALPTVLLDTSDRGPAAFASRWRPVLFALPLWSPLTPAAAASTSALATVAPGTSVLALGARGLLAASPAAIPRPARCPAPPVALLLPLLVPRGLLLRLLLSLRGGACAVSAPGTGGQFPLLRHKLSLLGTPALPRCAPPTFHLSHP